VILFSVELECYIVEVLFVYFCLYRKLTIAYVFQRVFDFIDVFLLFVYGGSYYFISVVN